MQPDQKAAAPRGPLAAGGRSGAPQPPRLNYACQLRELGLGGSHSLVKVHLFPLDSVSLYAKSERKATRVVDFSSAGGGITASE